MQSELAKLKKLTDSLTSNGYLTDQTNSWKYAFDSVNELVCITNTDLKLKFMNKEVLSRLDIHNGSYLNKYLGDFFNKEITSIEACISTSSNDTVHCGECGVLSLKGWFDITRTSIRDDRDHHIGYVFILVDVTDRKNTECKLKKSELKYRNIFKYTKDGVAVYITNDDGKNFIFSDFNEAAANIEKIKSEDVIGKRVQDVFPKAIEFGIIEVIRRVWATGKSEAFPMAFYEDDRISGWRDNYIYKLKSGEIVAIYSDETEKYLADSELEETNSLLKGVLDAIPDIISVQDVDNTIIMYNKAGREFFNVTNKQLKGKKCFEYLGNLVNCEKCQTKKCIKSKLPSKQERYIEKLDGMYDCRSYPVLDKDGEVIKVIEHLRTIKRDNS